MSGQLETVDLLGVEILEADVEIHGIGSPREGDRYTAADLRAMAAAAAELADEVRAPAKLGHSTASPAVGWVENQRVSADGRKLVADIKRVPKRFAELVRAGAYRARSAELARVKSQRTGKTYDRVVTGLAWLGAKAPAVRTLADVVSLDQVEALYESPGIELVRVYESSGASTSASESLEDFADADDYVDALVLGGRVPMGHRDALVRAFESSPDFGSSTLEALYPDDPVPAREYFEEERIAAELGIPVEDVVGGPASAEEAYARHMAATYGLREDEVL